MSKNFSKMGVGEASWCWQETLLRWQHGWAAWWNSGKGNIKKKKEEVRNAQQSWKSEEEWCCLRTTHGGLVEMTAEDDQNL